MFWVFFLRFRCYYLIIGVRFKGLKYLVKVENRLRCYNYFLKIDFFYLMY